MAHAAYSCWLLQQCDHVANPPFAQAGNRHALDETPAPRQHGKIFGRGKFVTKHPLETKLAESLDFSNPRGGQLHDGAEICAALTETDHGGFFRPRQRGDLALQLLQADSLAFDFYHPVSSTFE